MSAVGVSMMVCGAGVVAMAALIAVLLAERWDAVRDALAWRGEALPREVQLSLPFAA